MFSGAVLLVVVFQLRLPDIDFFLQQQLIVMHDLGGMGLCPQNPVASWGKLQSVVDTALNLGYLLIKVVAAPPLRPM